MKAISQTYVIQATVADVWRALTDPEVINHWGGGPATMNDQVGSEFKLWGGEIHGRNTEVIANQKLVQDWYSGAWPEASICQFELTPEGKRTILKLTHEKVPEEEVEKIADGWKSFYLGPLKKLLEGK